MNHTLEQGLYPGLSVVPPCVFVTGRPARLCSEALLAPVGERTPDYLLNAISRIPVKPMISISRMSHRLFLSVFLVVTLVGSSRGQSATKPRVIELKPVGNQIKYATTEITAKAGTEVKVVMNNTATSPAMVHNFTLLQQGAPITEVGTAAIEAGEENGFIPDHEAIIAYTEMAEPGEKKEVVFTVPSPGDYPYVCLYPGHYVTMRGVLHSTP